jgi:hypothetical protein
VAVKALRWTSGKVSTRHPEFSAEAKETMAEKKFALRVGGGFSSLTSSTPGQATVPARPSLFLGPGHPGDFHPPAPQPLWTSGRWGDEHGNEEEQLRPSPQL